MKNKDTKSLVFVVNHYKANRFNTEKAIDKFKSEQGIKPISSRIGLRIGAVAASLLIGAFVLTRLIITPQAEWVNIIATNDIVKSYLPDSTKVLLYPKSSISYDANSYAEDKRQVNMSGQIYFDVRRDEQRPFEVCTKLAKVEVLGTQFQVDENSDNTEVFVRSGKVRFSSMADNESVILLQDMFAELSNNDNSIKIIEQHINNPLAWAVNEFVYENTFLSEILDELSEFYDIELYCADPDKKLTATFSTKSLDDIIKLIEEVLGVKIERR